MTSQHLVHPDRPVRNFKPVKAFRHFRKLVEDKEDTEQVFHIIQALRGKDFIHQATDFVKSENGRRILDEERDLAKLLDDHDRLREMPAGSLADHYVRFMEREGLSAAGLIAEYERFAGGTVKYDDMVEWYANRLRDTHDLFHVITGYGRDPLGEQSLLAFTYSQNGNLGIIGIAYAGILEIRPHVPKGTPITAAVREGRRLGKQAKKIAEQPMLPLLARPIDEVRAELNVGKPVVYRECLRRMAEHEIDPNALLPVDALEAA